MGGPWLKVGLHEQNGVHQGGPGGDRAAAFDADTMKLLRTQDANYVNAHVTMETKVRVQACRGL
jgi:hypothetical protein